MTRDQDLAKMTDPEFLAERARVRVQLGYELTERHRRLDEEFLRRARIAWRWSEQ
jgi:hypothetical protein